ncbi:MAG: cysteine--tRNA ligase [Candidatus Dormibacteria bacterium]
MRLFDTLTGEARPLVPENGRVGMYVCGITPYDGGHLGHAFTYHTFDVLTRRLRMEGVTVRSVRNVTDVDDDILRVSRQRGVDWRDLGETETATFNRDMAAIDLLDVDTEPRASARVPEMVEWIETLVARGHAYTAEGWVYFDVGSYPEYGALSRLHRTAMLRLSAQRGADPDDPRKRDPLDFVLWQPSLPEEPAWPAPWSNGRPGWHIECTVLSAAELELPIDIHGGGDDLVYPHHESEIAQARGGGVESYVRHWVHVAMVGYRGEKMSKSLGNLVFVRDVLERTSAAVVRLLLCAHHHRSAWEYTPADLEVATTRAAAYASLLDERSRLDVHRARQLREDFLARLDDDLDMPGALEVLDAAAVASRGRMTADGVAAAVAVLPLLEVIGAGSLSAPATTPTR